MRARLLSALVCLVAAPGAAVAEPPDWSAQAGVAGGGDTNVRRDPTASTQGALLRVDGRFDLDTAWLRASAEGWFQQGVPEVAVGEGELEARVAKRRRVRPGLHLTVASLSLARRDRSVFADGQILSGGAVALDEVGETALAAFQWERGRLDLEAGLQMDLRYGAGSVDRFRLLGGRTFLGARLVPTPAVSVRVQSWYAHQAIDGLTPRNLAGGPVMVSPELGIDVLGAGVSGRWHPAAELALAVAYDYSSISDDFSGYHDGSEHRARVFTEVTPDPRWSLEVSADLAHRTYPWRQVRPSNQASDSAVAVALEARWRLADRLALVGRYQLEHTWADPFGLVYSRHTVLLGVGGRLGR